uniref:NTPase, KAP family P-loop domain containing 1 n=1 Tax=Oryzias latipes TaxID=8090 RepID=A0A3P9JFR3_ORYLA
MKQPPTDRIYAYALSKTLTKISSPATVGLYSSCQDRLNMILRHMEEYMDQEALNIEQARGSTHKSNKPPLCGFLMLIIRMFFYRPAWTKNNPHDTGVRFIHVHFSAWHFAGSDLLWAGIAMRLIESIQMKVGKLTSLLYRTTQHDEEEEVNKKDGPNHWIAKKMCCCPLWSFALILILIPIVILVILKTVNFPEEEVKPNKETEETIDQEDMFEGLLAASLGIPAVYLGKFVFNIGRNMIFSQVGNIRRAMDNDRMSSQLGFMNNVRKEIMQLSRFIQFMEVFEGRKICVVLKITNLERCAPKKIVGVLDAMNILLSDRDSPFISILAVDPHVLLEKINFADGRFAKQERAYALLNRIVTLAFTVPPLCEELRGNLFNSLTSDQMMFKYFESFENLHSNNGSLVLSKVKVNNHEECHSLVDKTDYMIIKEDDVKDLVLSIVHVNKTKLTKYMVDDTISMKRVISSVWVSVIIMKALKKDLPNPKSIGAWVFLANQWPCRLSWIIQCVEDRKQMAEVYGEDKDPSKTLLEVFNESRDELYVMRSQIVDLLEQDGDPEVFEKLLGEEEFGFTIQNLEIFQSALVNLDPSLKKELAQIRGTSQLKNFGWKRNLSPLPVATIINMTKEKICEEMENLKFDKKYTDIMRNNDIDGPALVFGDIQDLKALLGMNFGEWNTFKLHFLGISLQK